MNRYNYIIKLTKSLLNYTDYRIFKLSILTLFHCLALIGQPNKLTFNNLNIEDGMPDGGVYSLVQDSTGFIWVTSDGGLVRYDGHELKVYTRNLQKNSLSYTTCYGLLLDKHQNLWIGTQEGLNRYNRATDDFTLYKMPVLPNSNTSASGRFFKALLTNNNGEPVFIDEAGVVSKYNYSSDKLELLLDKPIHHAVKTASFDKNGMLWAGTIKGLAKVDLYKQEILHFPLYEKNVPAEIWSICHVNNKIWLSVLNSPNLYCFNEATESYKPLGINNNPNIRLNGITVNKNKLWISSSQGAICYDLESKDKKYYPINQALPNSNENNIYSIIFDNQNNIWATRENGISYAPMHENFSIINHEQHNLNIPVSAFAIDTNGYYWSAGYGNPNIQKINPHTKKVIKEYDITNIPQIVNADILELFVSSNNELFIGSYHNGLVRMNLKSGRTKVYPYTPNVKNTIGGIDVRDIKEDRERNLWMICHGYGFSKFNPVTNKFTNFNITPEATDSLLGMWFFDILIDHTNQLWFSYTGGICAFYPETESFKYYRYSPNDTTSISSNQCTGGFALAANNNFWIGTQYGLNYFNQQEQQFTRFYKEDGLPDNVIRTVVYDTDSNLWVGTSNGLCRLSFTEHALPTPKEMTVKHYSLEDGAGSVAYTRSTFAQKKNGDIILAGNQSLTKFNSKNIKENKYPPTPVLTSFSLLNKVIQVGESADETFRLQKQINQTETIYLDHQQNIFSIGYIGVNYYQNHNNQYAYILENYDNTWNDAGTAKTAEYRNVPPGSYTFKVKAANNDGYWSPTPKEINIIISPPWWDTWWFKLILYASAVALAALFFRLRLALLKKQKKQLEAEVNRQTHDLIEQAEQLNELNTELEERQQHIEEQSEELQVQKEELIEQKEQLNQKNTILRDKNEKLNVLNATKDKLFSIIAHDLKNPFSSLIGLLDLFKANYQRYDDNKRELFIRNISESADSIYKLLENLLFWARSQTKSVKFEPAILPLNEIIEINIDLYSEYAKKKNIEIINKVPASQEVFGDRQMLSTVFRNLLNNAIKYSQNGSITFSVTTNEKNVTCSIADTGSGMPPEKAATLFEIHKNKSTPGTDGEKGTGLGLIICYEFVQLHNGKINVQSTPGVGTTFLISLPQDQ